MILKFTEHDSIFLSIRPHQIFSELWGRSIHTFFVIIQRFLHGVLIPRNLGRSFMDLDRSSPGF